MSKFFKGLTLAGLVAATGCANVPVPPDYYAGIVKDLAPRKGLLVASGCAVRDEVGNTFVITDTSEAHSELWSKTAAPYLEAYGLPLSTPVIRMTCAGYAEKPEDKKVVFVPNKDAAAQATPGTLPHIVGTDAIDAKTAANLDALFVEFNKERPTVIFSAKQAPPRPKLKLTAEQIGQLRSATGADYVWLVATLEREVSMGKVVGTAVLTAVLSLGTVAVAPKGGRVTVVGLVDLNDGTLVWKKGEGNANGTMSTTATGGGTTPVTYQTQDTSAVSSVPTDQLVAANLLSPFLQLGAGLAGKAVTQPAVPTETTVAPPAQPAAEPAAPAASEAPPAPAATTVAAPAQPAAQ